MDEALINMIYLGDTLDLMQVIPDESIDLVITDPPYGMDYHGNRRKEKGNKWGIVDKKFDHIENDSGEEFEALLLTYIKECHRIMKDNTAMYMFCSWHRVGFFQYELEKYFTLKNLLVWNKNNHTVGDLYGSYAPKHELIWFCHKGRVLMQDDKRHTDVLDYGDTNIDVDTLSIKVTTNDAEIIDTNKITPKVGDTLVFNGITWVSTNMKVLDYDKIHSPIHPTMKPVPMLRKFVCTSSAKNDIVFDGFMGSGSTAVAAASEGRRFVGAELDPVYHQIATDLSDVAIKQYVDPKDIFG